MTDDDRSNDTSIDTRPDERSERGDPGGPDEGPQSTGPSMDRRTFLQATATATAATAAGLSGLGTIPESVAGAGSAGSGRWVARHGMSDAEYQRAFDKFVNQGYRLTHVSGYGVNGRAQYAALWEKTSGPAWRARHGMTASQYQNAFDEFTDDGYRLTHVSGYSVDGEARFAAIWEKTSGPAWRARHGMTASQYQNAFDEFTDDGYRLTHVSGYAVSETSATFFGGASSDESARYAAIWEKRNGPAWRARHGMTASQYQNAFDEFTDDGYRLTHVSGYSVDGEPRFAAIWEKTSGPAWEARHGLTDAEYQKEFDELAYQGYRLTDVSGYSVSETSFSLFGTITTSDSPRYAAKWEADGLEKSDIDAIDRQISNCMSQQGFPGVTVAITKDERLVFAKGYGMADKSANEEMRPSHRVRIASVSKPITAVAIMNLVEDGRLDLPDYVFGSDGILGTKYGRPNYDSLSTSTPERITVDHLLEHSAGWTVRGNPNKDDPMLNYYNKDQDELIEFVLDNYDLDNEPGTNYSYLNFGYCLLGRIIEEVTGQPYEEYVKDEVLAKCGIDGMAIAGDKKSDRKPDEVVYYGGSPYQQRVERMDAHGGWIASPIDLLRFAVRVDEFGRKPDILQSATLREMYDTETPNISYGEGWVLGGNNYRHNGVLDGSRAILERRDDGFSFAALANGNGNVGTLRNAVNTAIGNVSDWPDYDLF